MSKKLKLNKEVIAQLSDDSMNSVEGGGGFTGGCSDGCSTTPTWWNCTKTNCTLDCKTNVCDTGAFCTQHTQL